MAEIRAVKGDITRQPVDAIVNAANETLLGGGGVDGAIHRAAGTELLAACRTLGGCPTGQARITSGYRLPARYVIHTVGPVWSGGNRGEAQLLRRCYESALALAADHDVRSIAFPSISTGAYGFPVDQAARIAVQVVRARVQKPVQSVTFVCFSDQDLAVYEQALQEAGVPGIETPE